MCCGCKTFVEDKEYKFFGEEIGIEVSTIEEFLNPKSIYDLE